MAKARAAEQGEHDALKRDLVAVGLATLGALIMVSLIYSGEAMGLLPGKVSLALRAAVGLGAYAVPICLFILAAIYGLQSRPVAGLRVVVGTTLLVIALLVLLQVRITSDWSTTLTDPESVMSGGGYIGAALSYALLRLLGPPGAYIFIVGISFVGILLLTRCTARDLLAGVGNSVLRATGWVTSGARELATNGPAMVGPRGSEKPPPPRRRPAKPRKGKPDVDLEDISADGPSAQPAIAPQVEEHLTDEDDETALASGAVAAEDEPVKTARKPKTRARAAKPPRTRKVTETSRQRPLLKSSDLFSLPSTEMLTDFPDDVESSAARDEAAEQIIKLEDTLASFNIAAKVTHYERGPVLTRYEVEPERGIRVNQVVRLADDLAMALAAVDVRVEAPIPGKSAIGIEVPNPTRATVSLRAILEADEFQEHQSKVAFALGRDIAGKPVVCDLTTMPHLLIAGATGAGKSVCLHSLIVSLLMRATPDEVRLVMVDPKRVELAVYDGLPHLMAPVVHSVKQAADVLRKIIREMEKRYDQFAVKGVVNLAEYNELARMEKEHAVDEFDPLPLVVIVIDELADLMMQGRAEFEFSICRLAQLARATGIHLVLATQRPSVKVVTGNIKANVPSRIALAVASLHDSRTILDGQGAERLIGRGDMLYSPIDANKARRIQGAFVPRQDIEAVVRHLQTQGEPEFTIIPEVPEDEEDYSGEMEASDELFSAAAQYVIGEGEASVSMIQRRFKVGYARAGRLIDAMEQRGIVGPHEGSKPRQVLVAQGMADAVLSGRTPDVDLDDMMPDEFGDDGSAMSELDEGQPEAVLMATDDEEDEPDDFDEQA